VEKNRSGSPGHMQKNGYYSSLKWTRACENATQLRQAFRLGGVAVTTLPGASRSFNPTLYRMDQRTQRRLLWQPKVNQVNIFSAVFKVHETSTNEISRRYQEQRRKLLGQKK